jgi:hypothetical protein
LLGIAYGGIRPDQFFGQEALLLGVLETEQDFGMTHGQAPLGQVCLDFRVEFHKAHRIGNSGPAFADALGDLFLSQAEFLGKTAVSGGFLEGVQVGPLEVLDQRQLQDFLIGGFADNDRGLAQADFEGCAHTALTGDEFVFSTRQSDDQGLDDTPLSNGIHQVTELVISELGTGLKWARHDLVEPDLLDALTQFLSGHWSRDTGVDEGAEAFAQALAKAFSKPAAQSFS